MKRVVSILLFAVLVSGCMKHENLYNAEQAAEEDAKKNFPIQNIDPDQDWNMTTSRSLNVSVNEKTGGIYTIKIYDSYPFNSDGAYLLAKEEVKDGETKTIKFDAPTILERVYVLRQLTSTDYFVKVSDLDNEQFAVTFGDAPARAMEVRSVVKAVSIDSKYKQCPSDAVQLTTGQEVVDFKKNKTGNYVIVKGYSITAKDGVSLGKDAHLYIEGSLILKDKLNLQDGASVSVLNGGSLKIAGDLDLNAENGSQKEDAVFYNAGTVEANSDMILAKAVWVNDGTFNLTVSKTCAIGHDAKVQNNCRFIIGTKKNNLATALEIGSSEGSVTAQFSNQGYVEVNGNSIWHKGATINLAGGAVFNITQTLKLGNVTVVKGENIRILAKDDALIKADKLVGDNGKEEIEVEGTVWFAANEVESGNKLDLNKLPLKKHTLVESDVKDPSKCNVGYQITESTDDNDKLAVTTYGFEDTVSGATDYDFNDVVFHVSNLIDNKIKVTLVAAGATNAITAQYSLNNGVNYTDMSFNGESEVHAAFGKPITEMINTNRSITIPDSNFPSYEIENVPDGFSFATNGRICIKVDDTIIDSHNKISKVPYALSVPIAWAYPTERVRIDVMYEKFGGWGENMDENKDWYMFKTE